MITSTACRETDDAGLKKGDRIRSRQTIFFVRSFESRGERWRDATNREETRVSLEKARSLDALKMNAPSRPVENRPKRERERERGSGKRRIVEEEGRRGEDDGFCKKRQLVSRRLTGAKSCPRRGDSDAR